MAKKGLGKSTKFERTEKAVEVYSSLRRRAPVTRGDIKNYVKVYLGIDIPDKRICKGHNSPMDYLEYSFLADFAAKKAVNGDGIVWANRGGGKTELAAIATLLDCIFKPSARCEFSAARASRRGECTNI